MVFGNMVTIKARLVGRLYEFQPFVQLRCKRTIVAAINMVKQANFHKLFPKPRRRSPSLVVMADHNAGATVQRRRRMRKRVNQPVTLVRNRDA